MRGVSASVAPMKAMRRWPAAIRCWVASVPPRRKLAEMVSMRGCASWRPTSTSGRLCSARRSSRLIGRGRLQRRDDHAGEALAVERFERAHFGVGGVAGRGHERGVAARLGVRLHGAGEGDGIRVEEIAGQDADDVRPLGFEDAGVGVRDVVELFDRGEDGGARAGADVAGIVDDARDGGRRGAGESRDVGDGRLCQGAGNDYTRSGLCQRPTGSYQPSKDAEAP